jgi:hypothetical protein
MINLKELYIIYPIEDLFYQLTKDLTINKIINYENSILYFNKNNICIFDYNLLNKYLECSYREYWIIFFEKFNIKYNKIINEITIDLFNKNFNSKVIISTPIIYNKYLFNKKF